ncbi:hypothetical protein [Bacteroides acidifaciens]|uniref:Uncharacterized protein n=1 Tax=Bacteroides acidifaciens TaxID=85831 RepID=A0A3L8A3B1_9BACE|nr:hypothetical protein [Bacteroides acidifaciens]RLT78464.1 hypothetical protein D7Y07_19100 [Bacteroides acidifaciens]
MVNELNVPKLEYKTGEPMWVHWDNRMECFNDVIGRTPAEDLITTIGYLVYMDNKSIILGRSISNTEPRTARDVIQIPMSLVASYGEIG